MAAYNLITGHDLASKIAKALGLKHTRRIILDFGMDAVATVYVEFLGDERLYDIDFSGMKLEVTENEFALRNKS